MCQCPSITKSIADKLATKQGRVLSAANEARLSAALREIVAILESAGVDIGLEVDADAKQLDVEVNAKAGKYTVEVRKTLTGAAVLEDAKKRFTAAAIVADREQVAKALDSLNVLLSGTGDDDGDDLLSALASLT